tara:strand:+ start:163 stop:498 length:336 start_codon:yes stop_codon:yes gene_type:complete
MTRRRFKKQSRKRRKYRKKSTKKKRRKRRTRRKSGRGWFTKSTAAKLKADPDNYDTILREVLTNDGLKNVPIAKKIANSLGHPWLCEHKNIKEALDNSVIGTNEKVTGRRC